MSAHKPRKSQAQARAMLSRALTEAMAQFHASHHDAARCMGVHTRTVGGWVRQECAINVESVLTSPKLGKAFVDALSASISEAQKEAVNGQL